MSISKGSMSLVTNVPTIGTKYIVSIGAKHQNIAKTMIMAKGFVSIVATVVTFCTKHV